MLDLDSIQLLNWILLDLDSVQIIQLDNWTIGYYLYELLNLIRDPPKNQWKLLYKVGRKFKKIN